MPQVRITVIRKADYKDLQALYENPIENHCTVKEGQVWLCDGLSCPDGFCESAWEIVAPFAKVLSEGGGDFYDGWMKNPYSALLSCNDGFRPVSFLLEAVKETPEE